VTATARADTIEKSFFDFQALQQKFEEQKKVELQEGYVLENVQDKSGKKKGTFSFGGTNSVTDPYQQFPASTNFRGSRDYEIDGPKLNLRLSF
jgi:hypothetical protein